MGTKYRRPKCSAKCVVLVLTPREVRYSRRFKQRLDKPGLTVRSKEGIQNSEQTRSILLKTGEPSKRGGYIV